jgi:ribosome-associated translation inhibitor RaiA
LIVAVGKFFRVALPVKVMPMNTTSAPALTDVDTVAHGRVTVEEIEYARNKIRHLVGHTREPILHARVKISVAADPAVTRPALAQANLDVNGRMLRAHVAGTTPREAVDLLYERLRLRLGRMNQHWEARRGGRPVPAAHEWRHGTEAEERPAFWPRPPEQREIVRHKAYELARATPDEAVFDMEHLDYDFHLFTDLSSGQDAVVYRAGPTGYRLARLHPAGAAEPVSAVPLTVSAQSAPRLSTGEAIDRLNLTGWPFVFYADIDSGRARLLYRRYDGHYGLIRPADNTTGESP